MNHRHVRPNADEVSRVCEPDFGLPDEGSFTEEGNAPVRANHEQVSALKTQLLRLRWVKLSIFHVIVPDAPVADVGNAKHRNAFGVVTAFLRRSIFQAFDYLRYLDYSPRRGEVIGRIRRLAVLCGPPLLG